MSWLIFSLQALAFCFSLHEFLGASAFSVSGNETDRAALLEFKSKITNDALGVLGSWNDSIHFCEWYGVTCSPRHQRVTILDLQNLKLAGTLPPHIGNLSFLQKLDLRNNSFTNEIPPQIGHLRRLQILYLQINSFDGEIPASISNCSNLLVVSLALNHLAGKIPSEFGSLSKLQFLSTTANNLTGNIPSSLGNLSSLRGLSLSRNGFYGSIPDTFGGLKNLVNLSLVVNNLSGTIPPLIFNISSIQTFDVGSNYIEGEMPLDLGTTLPNIRIFSITGNQFTGSIPPSIPNATNLELFQVSENNLTGKVPHLERLQRLSWFIIVTNNLGSGGRDDDLSFLCSLTNATNLERLYVNNNNFGGLLPGCISNYSTTLQYLLVDNNKIFGRIPSGIGKYVNLQRLDMWNNQLSGTIPTAIGKLQNLGLLYLHGNKLSGNIPHSFGNLKMLIQLYLSDNLLQGSIPSSLGQCESLTTINLSYNNLSGNIPAQFIGRSSISVFIGLSNNQLTGSLPTEVGNLKNLEILDVSGNILVGEIPRSVGGCIRLEILDMHGNFFQGHIPSSLSSLRGLKALDLSQNNLSGEIPEFLAGFEFLQDLNISYNNLEGMVPTKGVFKNASAISLLGNNKLCGGLSKFQLPNCGVKKSKHRRLTVAMKLVIVIVSGLIGLALALSFLFLNLVKKRKAKNNPSNSMNSLLNLSYQNLYNATSGFSSANLIGEGGFGSVYKGILDEGKTIVAVKVFHLLHHGAFKSFIAECNALRNIRHRNLVKVLTACSGVDYQGNDFKALVYELMPNGSLDDWLHPMTKDVEAYGAAPRNLNLHQRLNIAIDVACALKYLHYDCQPQTAHCDLKPSNVLLDADLTAHLGDFGLARFLPSTHKQTSTIGIKGSIGYIAPEYGFGSEVSAYGDVYSYGILLLEMVTSKRPTNDMFEGDLNLHSFAKTALPDHVIDIVDAVILNDVEELTATNQNQRQARINSRTECLKSMVGIGVACSMELPQDRMNITNVVHELQSVKKILLGH
ncbi:putative LRR receptor-like serine/threonine-protein kinase [Citrus sinensis]|nr:probable LRR receptor-like serine/threonine-protein kinase At3g47570 [Citrus sinensis]KAH9669857.1 putative LRR receptor-like serine/threonine-protein kinase [Citrus sinensis]